MKVPATTDIRRIYIAGPMRGRPAFNYPKFNEAEKFLTAAGWLVDNPARIGEKYGTPEEINADPALLARLLKDELEIVKECDAVFLLPDWEKSSGARKEVAVAIENGADLIISEEMAANVIGYIQTTYKHALEKWECAKDRYDRYKAAADFAQKNLDRAKEELDRLTDELTAARKYTKENGND